MRRIAVTTAVDATVDVLRDEILDLADGEWLGSEDDLLERLGISRPTLRQAARLLEAEELLVVKRGLNGGLFARRPSTDAVARIASVYLRAERTTVVDLARSWFLLLEQSARLAAEEANAEERACLVEELADMRASIAPDDPQALFSATQTFALRLADLSHSPTARLFTRVLSTLIANAPADLRPVPGLASLSHTKGSDLQRVAAAIRAGDGALAARNIRRHGEQVIRWLIEQMPDRTL
jgi:GntR family transcriptional repressor for pyruvate dehydrogenase complex